MSARAAAPRTKKSGGKVGYLDFIDAVPAEPQRLIVIGGKEPSLADDVLERIVAAVLPDESLRALNVDVIDARETSDFGAIAEKSAALPFLAPRRVVIVRGTIDLKKEQREEIVAAAALVPEGALLIVDHSGKPARPQGRKPADEAAAFAKALPDSLIVDVTLNAAACERYIQLHADRLGVKIDPAAAEALASIESVTEIKNSLELLSLVKKHITEDDVREYALPSTDAKFWDLASAINDGQAEIALRMARELVADPGDAIGPLIWLAAEQQMIWELRNGARAAEYAAATGQNTWRVSKLLGAGRGLTSKELKERVDVTMAALERSLTGRRQPDQALEEVIVRLTARKQ